MANRGRPKGSIKKTPKRGRPVGSITNPFKVQEITYNMGRVKRGKSREVQKLMGTIEKMTVSYTKGVPIMHTTADKKTARSWANSAVGSLKKQYKNRSYSITTLTDNDGKYVGTAILRLA